jgi:hypothetical protein
VTGRTLKNNRSLCQQTGYGMRRGKIQSGLTFGTRIATDFRRRARLSGLDRHDHWSSCLVLQKES